MYSIRSYRHTAIIDGKEVHFDSMLEHRVVDWLEANGFSGRWRRLDAGFRVGNSNYSPDLELLIMLDGKLYRSLVEIKPTKRNFTKDISRRMRDIAGHYGTKALLLCVESKRSFIWYRVDRKTGNLAQLNKLIPANKLIEEILTPLTIPAPSTNNHLYRQRPRPLASVGNFVLSSVETVIMGPKKAKKIQKSRRRKK